MKKKLLFLGDSITDSHRLFLNTPHTLGDGYVSLIADALPQDLYRILNRGHDGFTSEDLRRCLERDCLSLRPDVVSILIGVNDIPVELYTSRPRIPTEFRQYCRDILTSLTEAGITSILLMEPFVFSRPQEYQLWQPYAREESLILQELSLDFHARFLPLADALHREDDVLGRSPYTVDGLHLSSRGAQLVSELWLSEAFPLL